MSATQIKKRQLDISIQETIDGCILYTSEQQLTDEEKSIARSNLGLDTDIVIDDVLSTTSTNPVQNNVITNALDDKQDSLISGTNIKTINGNSILGYGNLIISGGSGGSAELYLNDDNNGTVELTVINTSSTLNINDDNSGTVEITLI